MSRRSRGQSSRCKGPEEKVSPANSRNTKENSVAKAGLTGRDPHLTGTHMGPAAAFGALSNPLLCTAALDAPGLQDSCL